MAWARIVWRWRVRVDFPEGNVRYITYCYHDRFGLTEYKWQAAGYISEDARRIVAQVSDRVHREGVSVTAFLDMVKR